MSFIDDTYRQFSTQRFPLPSVARLDALEERLAVRFPQDYREYILAFNGGYFDEPEIFTHDDDGSRGSALLCMLGIGTTHPEAELGDRAKIEMFEENDPPQLLPIGFSGMGVLILLVTRQEDDYGAIFLKKPFGDFYHIADSIEEFFGLLQWPSWRALPDERP